MDSWQSGGVTLYQGDCLDILRQMPDNSIDALVTDPPAGIGFMGVGWDTFGGRKTGNSRPRNRNGSGEWDWIGSKERPRTADQQKRVTQKQRDAFVAWFTPIMSECLRVLKPGAHALVWALPRTSHWTGWALEEAGFEVRDRIAHLFGSGFPKSANVSKMLDKMARREYVDAALRLGMPMPDNSRWDWTNGEHSPSDKWWDIFKSYLSPEQWQAIEREVIGKGTSGTTAIWNQQGNMGDFELTAPATPAAVQWQGWGTALKPACEDWWLCRKPLAEGTVAANVIRWGTGAINIDATRIPTNGDNLNGGAYAKNGTPRDDGWGMQRGGAGEYISPQGRWPANVVHDGSEEVLAGFPMTTSGDKLPHHKRTTPKGKNAWAAGIGGGLLHAPDNGENYPGDSGSAARFFYCAKASRQDREEGCEGLEEALRRTHGDTGPCDNAKPNGQGPINCHNHHPTVKPTPLMRWLCRLITPPGGTVLDPFMGSGSTGKAATLEGFGFVGIEIDPTYFEIAKRRIEQAMLQPRLEGF